MIIVGLSLCFSLSRKEKVIYINELVQLTDINDMSLTIGIEITIFFT